MKFKILMSGLLLVVITGACGSSGDLLTEAAVAAVTTTETVAETCPNCYLTPGVTALESTVGTVYQCPACGSLATTTSAPANFFGTVRVLGPLRALLGAAPIISIDDSFKSLTPGADTKQDL